MRTEARGISLSDPTAAELLTKPISESLSPIIPTKFPAIRLVMFGLLAGGGLYWDLWSKWAVFDKLGVQGQMRVWKGALLGLPIQFDLATTFNPGALWGIGQGQTWFFATLSILAVLVIGYFVWSRQAIATWWLTIASGLLLAGTLGNLYDRMGLHGWRDANGPVYAVRDFLDFIFNNGGFHWATFNFADVYLMTGAVMLVIQSFSSPKPDTAALAEQPKHKVSSAS